MKDIENEFKEMNAKFNENLVKDNKLFELGSQIQKERASFNALLTRLATQDQRNNIRIIRLLDKLNMK